MCYSCQASVAELVDAPLQWSSSTDGVPGSIPGRWQGYVGWFAEWQLSDRCGEEADYAQTSANPFSVSIAFPSSRSSLANSWVRTAP